MLEALSLEEAKGLRALLRHPEKAYKVAGKISDKRMKMASPFERGEIKLQFLKVPPQVR